MSNSSRSAGPSSKAPARMSKRAPLTPSQLQAIDAYWRAANYLSACQLYLWDNPLLQEPLRPAHLKGAVVGHWGTCPGQNFIYTHLNRVIVKYDLNMIYISGPGHGGNAMVAQSYLDGSYSEIYPNISQDLEGMKRLFRQFSFPGGIPSHTAPQTPGSINQGGELGHSLSHAFGAVLDNPTLIAACVVGDGEAETGPLATAWHANKLLSPAVDGAVLPILHLNGWKGSSPSLFSHISHEELSMLLKGYGWEPRLISGSDPLEMHQKMASALDWAIRELHRLQEQARTSDPAVFQTVHIRWPMLVFRSPKGWTGPQEGTQRPGGWRYHQSPIPIHDGSPGRLAELEHWLRSYRPEELFDAAGGLRPALRALAPQGIRRMGANPHANGGLLLQELRTPDFRLYGVDVPKPGAVQAADTNVVSTYVAELLRLNAESRNFRIFGPDLAIANHLTPDPPVSLNRSGGPHPLPTPSSGMLSHRVMDSMLSEHLCQGCLEGYLLTGRHGLFTSYESFIRIVDSMVAQHAKWLKVCNQLPWRQTISSLNYILASHVWQQDHNGFAHQDPGFLNHIANQKSDVVRLYLPPDANCLLSCLDHCVKSRSYINVMVASKNLQPQWLTMEQAVKHCTQGIGIWQWASNDKGLEPDVVMACCGDTPTLEVLAAVTILRHYLPDLHIRVINVVDVMKLQSHTHHPHGLTHEDYDALFTKDRPIIFAFHGYPTLIHQLTYRRHNKNLCVQGYREEGTITTPFDMRVQNHIDRFDLVIDTVKRLPQLGNTASYLIQEMQDKLVEHHQYITTYGQDMPEVRQWTWNQGLGIYSDGNTEKISSRLLCP